MNLELVDPETIAITDAFKQKAACAQLDDARWSPMLKCWLVAASESNVVNLAAMCSLPADIAALGPPPTEQVIIEDPATWLTLGPPPWEHQRHAVGACMAHLRAGARGFALLMEQRTGKTRCALEVASRLEASGVRRVLVVALKTPCSEWAKQAAEYLPMEHRLEILSGTPKKRRQMLEELTGFDGLSVAVVAFQSAWRTPELLAWGADLIVVDEMQHIKTPTSKQTKGVVKLAQGADYRLGLTGTAILQGPLDVFAQYLYVEPTLFGESFYAFKARYSVSEPVIGAGGRPLVVQGKNGKRYTPTQIAGYRRLVSLSHGGLLGPARGATSRGGGGARR